MAGPRIPVTLLTGFLGSGKTTFLNAALKAPEMKGVIVVINEFGEVGLDHALVAQSNDTVVVLENGCLCCTVRSDLVGTLNSLWQSSARGEIPAFTHMVIETSGLAEPAPVMQAFLSEPTLDGLYRVAGVVTLVDAVNWPGTATEHDEAVRQVALADRICVTKLDLAGPEAEAALMIDLKRINPAAKIMPVDWSQAAAALTADGFDAADPKADPRPWLHFECHDHEHGHDHTHEEHFRERGIESHVLIRTEPISRAELQLLIDGIGQNLGSGLLRVKGLVNVLEEPGRPAVIQGAQHLLHTMTWLERWPDADERTRVVFITQGIAKAAVRELIALIDRMSARTFKARARAEAARAQ